MAARQPIPLRPDWSAVPRPKPADQIIRAALSTARAARQYGSPAGDTIECGPELWAEARAATAPATTTTSGWAAPLVNSPNVDLITTPAPTSASGELFKRATVVNADGRRTVNIPGVVPAATDAVFVVEGGPIPARQLPITSTPLALSKLAVTFALTRELYEASTPDAEALVRRVITESVGAQIDAALFDAVAGSTTRPAGLRNGVTVTTATTGGTADALRKDLGNLAAAVAGVAGGQIAFVAAPGEAVKILLQAGPEFRFPVFASSGLAAGVVLAIALPALVVAVDPQPRIEASRDALIHLDDATPLAIGTAGSPATVAAPTTSLWQTDSVSLRIILPIAWGLRASGSGIAFTSSVTW